MRETIATLLTSKRFLVAVVTIVVDVALVFGVDLDPEQTNALLTAITSVAAMLIGGISLSDHGKALGQPAGVDHKGRGLAPAQPEDTGAE